MQLLKITKDNESKTETNTYVETVFIDYTINEKDSSNNTTNGTVTTNSIGEVFQILSLINLMALLLGEHYTIKFQVLKMQFNTT